MSSGVSGAVAVSAFRQLLQATSRNGTFDRSSSTIGIGVSGGIDSMALAFLCSQIQKESPSSPTFHAFVVDHGSREGSAQEAQDVAGNLRSLGLSTSVLNISWPTNVDPLTLPSFESLARTGRFQALGRACADRRIKDLLLAHHKDDQAETVLMRIIQGYTGAGLQGTRRSAKIPECFGLAGAHQSVDSLSTPRASGRTETALPGVLVHRPLLGVTKSDLRETCSTHKVEWKEDHTNSDPTLTLRNAVRHVFTNHRLPRALQKDRLTALASKVDQRNAVCRREGIELARRFGATALDTRSGTVRLLIRTADQGLDVPYRVQVECLKYLSSFVSPCEALFDDSFHNTALNVFPKRSGTNICQSSPGTFTAGSTLWTRRPIDTSEQPDAIEWRLHRQPISAQGLAPLCQWTWGSNQSNSACEEWQLFDGRFWLRVWNSRVGSICARLFSQSDMSRLRSTLPKAKRRRLENILKEAAPDSSRWTLPILTTAGDSLLCLPSLGFDITDDGSFACWNLGFKHVDFQEGCPPVIKDRIT